MNEQPEQRTRPLSPPLSPRLSIYRWHPGMIASIAHRGSGLILVLCAPLYLWLLHGMADNAANFATVFDWLHSGMGKFSLWLAGVALVYHFCNGIRFLTMDAGWGESRARLRSSAKMVIAVSAVAALLLAGLLCIA
ncbi:MAG: succinate dehydrogenase, cytochrome b556 subunit [Mariprofundus sp.]|nr:succinate dehydrogenase, cytochrome b556 subunit [Mariprofundus sp.]